jgi:hypothetical protein
MDLINSAAIAAAPTYNEAKVRYHLIDPLIRHLGYGENETSYLDLEHVLKYAYIHIGRRSDKDVPLGKADYLAGLKALAAVSLSKRKLAMLPSPNWKLNRLTLMQPTRKSAPISSCFAMVLSCASTRRSPDRALSQS